MFRTRVKICGVTRVEDALLACELGADAIGIMMTPTSPRCVSIARARAIRDALPAFVDSVAVMVDPEISEIESIVSAIRPQVLQFHGHEEPELCSHAGLPYIKAVSMNEALPGPLEDQLAKYGAASAILLDGRIAREPADGRRFDWRLVPEQIPQRLILAGGINDANVASAIETLGPYAVDVSSGVEAAAGVKEPSKLMRFFAAVRSADRHRGV